MSFLLKIKDVENYSDGNLKKTIRSILLHMKKVKQRDSYSNYAPNLDFGLPLSRKIVGEALGTLWEYCVDENLPWLNLLIVGASDDLPGAGIRKWYEENYGTLKDYDKFCEKHAEISELMLNNGCIEIVE